MTSGRDRIATARITADMDLVAAMVRYYHAAQFLPFDTRLRVLRAPTADAVALRDTFGSGSILMHENVYTALPTLMGHSGATVTRTTSMTVIARPSGLSVAYTRNGASVSALGSLDSVSVYRSALVDYRYGEILAMLPPA